MPVSMWMAAPPDHPERRQNTSHSASSLRSPITGLAIELREGVAAVLKEAVEHVEFGRRQRFARGARFIQGGDEKRLAAGGRQRPRHRFDAAAIGVGLDHGGAFGRHRGLLELAPVGDDGVEIDGEDARLRRRLPRPAPPRRSPPATTGRRAGSISDRKRGSCRTLRARGAWFNLASAVSTPAPANGCPGRDRRTASGWPRIAVPRCRSGHGAACR